MTTDVDRQTLERLLLKDEVEEFYLLEADLLDYRHYDEWLDLLTEDMNYWMPISRNVKFGHSEREHTSNESEISWFDEPKWTLVARVKQLDTGLHWAEEPLSRVSHIVTNIRIVSVEGDEIRVNSRFFIYRNRLDQEQDFLIGKREDVLRRVDGQLKVANRKVILDQRTLLAKNFTAFF